MGRHVSELTIEELAKAGAEAADAAVSDALAAGVAVTGYLSDEAGNVWLVRQQPDGQTEWLELVEAAPAAEPANMPSPRSKLAS
jgi:gamma-glutamyltranspeptidase